MKNNNKEFEKELNHLKEDLTHLSGKIKEEEEEIRFQKKEEEYLKNKEKELEEELEKMKHHGLDLIFVVNGEEARINNVNHEEALKVAVEAALKATGNVGRPVSDWIVRWENKVLDVSKKVCEFNFPECAQLDVNLKSGQGGNQ